jgi:hypothetical protein
MSRSSKSSHGRKLPTRISQEELKTETMKYLASKGANSHFQATFYAHTSETVIGSPNPKFVTLQPKIKANIENEAWAQAFEFLYSFLESKEMSLTLKTAKVEFGKAGEPPRGGLFEQMNRDIYFGDLLALQRESFNDQVESYAGSIQ